MASWSQPPELWEIRLLSAATRDAKGAGRGSVGARDLFWAPTPALPESLDFALRPQEEPDRYDVVVLGDIQPRDLTI